MEQWVACKTRTIFLSIEESQFVLSLFLQGKYVGLNNERAGCLQVLLFCSESSVNEICIFMGGLKTCFRLFYQTINVAAAVSMVSESFSYESLIKVQYFWGGTSSGSESKCYLVRNLKF
eukprot:TRINITY_DN79927_c0_g1_i1.p1 TRINITY_DN79927_c0_g1~~TRINITY_DN79927_c0_g1_i1.p1  ORF type:complete len:119 (-),score=15.14 TRINITY_DN79927_c0_g1_i1:186-542(-)